MVIFREDPANEKGGCFTFRIEKKETPKVWPELLMLLVGEQLDGIIAAGMIYSLIY
jgi:hypothetical protein